MTENTHSSGSYWSSTITNPVSYPALESDLDVDVVVIGAGIVGLTVAERLCREGKSVVVLEALRVGAQVTARDVIVSTHQPIVPDGMFFAKAFPFSHSIVAAPLDDRHPLGGMCITSGEPSFSFRDDTSGGQRYVVAVGPTFKTGVTAEEANSFAQLERFLQETFGVDAPTYRWTNEDFAPMDGLPFVGRASSGSPHLFVAVGFNAWGITTGTAAATLITDLIMDRPSPCAELFDASRIRPLKGGAQFIKGNIEFAKHFIADRYGLPKQISDLAKGQATIARVKDETVAAYCDDAGTPHTVSAACTHMGCLVGWNQTDKSWDCPCDGSRFDTDGSVLHGPATAPLKKLTGMI